METVDTTILMHRLHARLSEDTGIPYEDVRDQVEAALNRGQTSLTTGSPDSLADHQIGAEAYLQLHRVVDWLLAPGPADPHDEPEPLQEPERLTSSIVADIGPTLFALRAMVHQPSIAFQRRWSLLRGGVLIKSWSTPRYTGGGLEAS